MKRPIKRPKIGGAVYVLPNLLTTGNLFFGFFSVVKSLQGNFYAAGTAILLAAVFDVLDGRVARLTRGTSEFGVQYDSLCDLVSFGMAPALLMFQFALHDIGRVGWIFCFLFMACGALRLARFNVQSSVGKASGDFTGLPIPMAAAVVACFVALVMDMRVRVPEALPLFLLHNILVNPTFTTSFLLVAAPTLAIAMVSNLAYRSHKTIRVKGIGAFNLLVAAVVVGSFVAYEPELLGFILFTVYALSGPFEWLVGWKKPTEESEIFAPHADDESMLEPDEDHGADLLDAMTDNHTDTQVQRLHTRYSQWSSTEENKQ